MLRIALPVTVLLATTACFEEPMTNSEAREAMQASFASERGPAVMTEPIEISTSFTLGAALEQAAQEVAAWIQSQIPCATVTRDGATITVDFGTLEDACVYDGHTYAGQWEVTIEATDATELRVSHAWKGLTNGEITLNGTSLVTWSGDDATRTVQNDVTWTDGALVVDASGDRAQALIDPEAGLGGGIQVDGSRDWTITGSARADGDWHLDIDGVQMRGEDPVPQAGVHTLSNPEGKSVSLTFERVDDDTIRVTFDGLRRNLVVLVNRDGQVEGDEPTLEF